VQKTDNLNPEEIIAKLEMLIKFFEEHKFVIQSYDEKKFKDSNKNRKRNIE